MKTTKQIASDILQSLGQTDNPVGLLLETYLKTVITDIVTVHITGFQIDLSDDGRISSSDWSFEDRARDHFINSPIK